MKSRVYFVPASYDEDDKTLAEKVSKLVKMSGIVEGIAKDDYVGIKLHFGEKDNIGFIRPSLAAVVGDLCKERSQNCAFLETNTIYIGSRSNTISHLNLAHSHGFTYANTGLPIVIADGITGRDHVNLKIDKKHIKEAKIASGIIDFDYIVSMAHVTGHCQTGLAASIKNIGMGCASRAGKLEQHSTVLPEITKEKCLGCGLCIKWCPKDAIKLVKKKAVISKEECIGCGECTVACRVGAIEIKWNESIHNLQEKMAEYAYAALKDRRKGFMNFAMHITKDCDCMAKDEPTITRDLGILASLDPVALDKATMDLLIKDAECDRLRDAKDGYPNIDWNIQLEYSAKLGLGNLDYELITVD
ncbi:MAG: DUF362 domain-containing protein [Candidatus Omnitrophica bacterium]|nr:DUF362 domain-containing protein [Candidatus Omnitrophota bacterium]